MDFTGKTVVITGAGGGLGASHARAFALRGANVVVNDPGVQRDGSAAGSPMAEAVVRQIREAGGHAVAHTDSIAEAAGAESLMTLALETFGRIDILVNNAGILRDRTLVKMSEEEWDQVVAVHLKGTFLCARAACRHMKERAKNGQPGGAVINTTSTSGLLGNFGQSNYGAAKAGIAGFTRTLAQEMIRYGVRVNAIAPIASTRMTEDLPEVPASFRPEQVSPLVVYLASDEARAVNGRIFGAAGGQLQEYFIETSLGKDLGTGAVWTPEQIALSWKEITARRGHEADDSSDSLSILFEEGLARAFNAEKAGDFATRIHFRAGASAWTAEVKDGKLAILNGLAGHPAAVVEADSATMLGVLSGTGDPVSAFASGKLRLTSPEVVLRFQQCF